MKRCVAILSFTCVIVLLASLVPLQGARSAHLPARLGRDLGGNDQGTFLSGAPTDAQSTTGPLPPPDVAREELGPLAPEAQVLISNVPAYDWYRGCGPTAAGMVLGYWDGNGFDNLVPGSAATQTQAVNDMISSSGNWDDYCLPLDYYPTMLPDKSEPPEGDEHADNCVADLMDTSQSYSGNYYGWSWFSAVDDALTGYVQMVAPEYAATATNQYWGTFDWDSYRAEIDAGRPVVLLVDTNADGGTDHFVTAIGYSDEGGTPAYACLNTWDHDVHWYEFAQIAYGQPWGIFGATLFEISTTLPSAPSNLQARALSPTRIGLNWTDNSSNETGFEIERSPDGATNWAYRATVGADITTYADTGLTGDTAYYYRTRAVNAGGPSGYSNVAYARTFSGPMPPVYLPLVVNAHSPSRSSDLPAE